MLFLFYNKIFVGMHKTFCAQLKRIATEISIRSSFYDFCRNSAISAFDLAFSFFRFCAEI